MKIRKDAKATEKVELKKNFIDNLSSEIFNKDTDDYSDDSVVVAHAKIVEEHEEKVASGQNIVLSQLGINPNDDKGFSKRQKIFKLIVSWSFILFVFAVFTYTFYNDFFATDKDFPSWEYLGETFKNSWQFLFYALASLATYYLFRGVKLSFMCKSLTGRFRFKTCVETGLIGTYYNCVTPLAVGGQPFEIYHLSKHGVHGGVAGAMPIAAFFMNQLAFVLLGTLAFVLFKLDLLGLPSYITNAFPPVYSALTIIGLVSCFVMPLLVLIFSMMPRFGAKMVTIGVHFAAKLKLVKNPEETTEKTVKNIFHNSDCLRKVFANPWSFFYTLFLSFGLKISEASIAFFALKMFGYDLVGVSALLEWIQVVLIASILYASISFIPTPGNSGAADLSFYLLFEAGLYAGLAFPAMLVWRILSFYSHIILGFVFIRAKRRSDHKKEKLHIPLT